MMQWKHRWEGKTVNENNVDDLRKVLTEVVDIHAPLKKKMEKEFGTDYLCRHGERLVKDVGCKGNIVNIVREKTLNV